MGTGDGEIGGMGEAVTSNMQPGTRRVCRIFGGEKKRKEEGGGGRKETDFCLW